MSRRVVVQEASGRLVVGVDPAVKRLEVLTAKPVRTQLETLEEILLRLKRIEAHLGIS